ncbi:MAG TPA: hypothetical protein VKB03_11260 [Conexibacter sp.]|nr:hypothetical protein [Conexibacter sp.]
MAVQKRSISFDESVLAEAERLSAERGGNLSAFVNAAVEHQMKVEGGRKLIAEDIEKYGPIPESVIAEIDALWPD